MQVASATKTNVSYELTISNGKAIKCSCTGYSYRHTCHHMTDYKPAVLWSNVCGHRVKSDIYRSCGCDA